MSVHVEVYAERDPAKLHGVTVTKADLSYVALDAKGQPRAQRSSMWQCRPSAVLRSADLASSRQSRQPISAVLLSLLQLPMGLNPPPAHPPIPQQGPHPAVRGCRVPGRKSEQLSRGRLHVRPVVGDQHCLKSLRRRPVTHRGSVRVVQNSTVAGDKRLTQVRCDSRTNRSERCQQPAPFIGRGAALRLHRKR